MRAREFVINIPIHVTINGDGEPEVNMADVDDNEPKLMMTPQQQELELAKAQLGKQSPAIDQLLQNESVDPE